MPIYEYGCTCGEKAQISHGVGQIVKPNCPACGKAMRRRYTMPNVKWSSFIQPSPAIAEHLANADRNRDAYQEKHNG